MRCSIVALGFVIALSVNACSKKQEKEDGKEKDKVEYTLGILYQEEITRLKKGMMDYQKMTDSSYTEQDVNQVSVILNEYIEQMEHSTSKEEGLAIVHATVEKFNALNEKCGLELISTLERDVIATIIIRVNHKKGYGESDEDITEEWRDW